jgi:hypothetical protein
MTVIRPALERSISQQCTVARLAANPCEEEERRAAAAAAALVVALVVVAAEVSGVEEEEKDSEDWQRKWYRLSCESATPMKL